MNTWLINGKGKSPEPTRFAATFSLQFTFSAAHYETCKSVLGNRLWGFCWPKKGAADTLQSLLLASEWFG